MKRLRIFYDFEAFSDQSRGGITRYILELASRIAPQAEVLVHAGVHRSLALRESAPSWARGWYLPAWPKTGEIRRRLNAFLTRRAIQRFHPDIVHRTTYRHGATYRGLHREVVTLYDFTCFHFPEEFAGGDVVCSRMRRVANSADQLICISSNTQRDAVRFLGASEAKTRVIPLGVNPPREVSGAAPPCPRPYLLFVGERGGYKNFRFVLQALAGEPRLAAYDLVAFGGGRFSADEDRTLAALGLALRTTQIAGDDRALAAAYAHAAVLVYPSRYEGFGLPIVEAMAHGCPVACSNSSSLPEVAGDAAEFFSPDVAAELAAAVGRAVLDLPRRDQLVRAGRQRAAQLTWDACAAATMGIYRSLAPS